MRNTKLSRRRFMAALGLGTAALWLGGCGPAGSTPDDASGQAPASSLPEEAEAEPFLTPEEFPGVDGSTACIPLIAQMMADAAGVPLEEAQSSVTVSTTAYAWENMGVYGSSDIGLLVVYEAPDYVKEEIAAAGVELEQKAVGRDALVFIVNEENPVQSLTLGQLRDIYAGRVTNWSEVGGADAPIVAFQRGEDSGSQTLFQKLLIGDGELMEAPTELAPASMGGLVDSVAAYNNSANAIGFSVYYYIDQMYSQPGLRLLAVEGVEPSNDTIAAQEYPLCNDFYAVIRANAAPDSPERRLYDWLSPPTAPSAGSTTGCPPMRAAPASKRRATSRPEAYNRKACRFCGTLFCQGRPAAAAASLHTPASTITRMGSSLHLSSRNRLSAKISTITQLVAARAITASPQKAVTRMESPAEAISATTAGRREPSTPCNKAMVRYFR